MCVTPACPYGTEILAGTAGEATGMQKQLGAANSGGEDTEEGRREEDGRIGRRYYSVAKEPRARMVDNRLKRAGHVERMAEDRLTTDAHGEEGRRRRGRPRLRWKDYVRNEGIKGNWRGIGARQKIM